MADRKDITDVIQSALSEIGVAGRLNLEMDGKTTHTKDEDAAGEDMDVTVHVEPSPSS
jgi:hypothetical protein